MGKADGNDKQRRQQESQSRCLKQRIEALEEEKSRLMKKVEEQSQKIKHLKEVIEESNKSRFKTEEQVELRLLEREEGFMRAEFDWLRLELSSASAESELAMEELRQMRSRGRDLKSWISEEEKAAVIERIGRWMMESEIPVGNFQEGARNEILERDKGMQRLKEDLEELKVKNIVMEKKILEMERVMEEGREWGVWRGMKLPWPAAALAWTAVTAVMIFLRCGEQRRQ